MRAHFENQMQKIGYEKPLIFPRNLSNIKCLPQSPSPSIQRKGSMKLNPIVGRNNPKRKSMVVNLTSVADQELQLNHRLPTYNWIQKLEEKIKAISPKKYIPSLRAKPNKNVVVIQRYNEVGKNLNLGKTFLTSTELFAKETEIFSSSDIPSTRYLSRFDCWEMDKKPEEWLQQCKEKPDESHGLSPVFENGDYVWRHLSVIDYDSKIKKFQVKMMHDKSTKWISRLALLFHNEDKALFIRRINESKKLKKHFEYDHKFQEYLSNIPKQNFIKLPQTFWYKIEERLGKSNNLYFLEYQRRLVEEDFIRQMKKCFIFYDMQNTVSHKFYFNKKLPIKFCVKAVPYYGVELIPPHRKYKFLSEFRVDSKWMEYKEILDANNSFMEKVMDFNKIRFVKVNKNDLSLHKTLFNFSTEEDSFMRYCKRNMHNNWREALIRDFQRYLGDVYPIFKGDESQFDHSEFQRIMKKYDIMFNHYMRDFLSESIQDWVKFIDSFVTPQEGEFKRRANTPLLYITLNISKPDSNKIIKKIKEKTPSKTSEETKNPKEKKEEKFISIINESLQKKKAGKEKENFSSKIVYSPSIEECQNYFVHVIKQMIDYINSLYILSNNDLIIYLNNDKTPAYEASVTESYIVDSINKIEQMIKLESQGPIKLLEKFSKYNFVLQIKKSTIKDMFIDKKYPKPNDLRKLISDLVLAKFNLQKETNNEVFFSLFLVETKKLKQLLVERIDSLVKYINEETSKFCIDNIKNISERFDNMIKSFKKVPKDEKELLDQKKFVNDSKEKIEELNKLHLLIGNFIDIIEESNITHFDLNDYQNFFSIFEIPIEVKRALSEGKKNMEMKEEIFRENLQKEKDTFIIDLEGINSKF